MASANQAPTILDYAAQLMAGTSVILALSFGGDPSASNRTGFYGDLTAAAEKVALVVGGQTGPIWTRSGSVVNVTLSGGALTAGSITNSSLTSGRVPYATTAGLMTDAAGLTFDGTSTLTVGPGSSTALLVINGGAGSNRQLRIQSGGSTRWRIGGGTVSESGSNAGTEFLISATDDSGALLDSPLTITRALGGNFTVARPLVSSYAEATAVTPGVNLTGSATITGGVTDGYVGCIRSQPAYSAASALTVTRHNYFDIRTPTLSGTGPAALTNACVFRFDAAAGTHKALDSSSTKTTPGDVDAWMKVNVNGTIYYSPLYTSKTT